MGGTHRAGRVEDAPRPPALSRKASSSPAWAARFGIGLARIGVEVPAAICPCGYPAYRRDRSRHARHPLRRTRFGRGGHPRRARTRVPGLDGDAHTNAQERRRRRSLRIGSVSDSALSSLGRRSPLRWFFSRALVFFFEASRGCLPSTRVSIPTIFSSFACASTAKLMAAGGAHPYYTRFLEEIRALPGVVSAGGTTGLPMDELDTDFDRPFWREGEPRPEGGGTGVQIRMPTMGYFDAMHNSASRRPRSRLRDDRSRPRCSSSTKTNGTAHLAGRKPDRQAASHRLSKLRGDLRRRRRRRRYALYGHKNASKPAVYIRTGKTPISR